MARKAYESLRRKRLESLSNDPEGANPETTLLPYEEVVSQGDLGPAIHYAQRLDLLDEEDSAHLFFNGKHITLGGSWQRRLQSSMAVFLRYLQSQVRHFCPYNSQLYLILRL